MSIRVTQTQLSESALFNLQRQLRRGQTLSNQLATGQVVSQPSDDPERFLTGQQARGAMARTETYKRSAYNAEGWITHADDALQQGIKILHRIEDLSIRANTASLGDDSRESIAKEIDQLKLTMLELASTEFAGRKVFGGSKTVDGALYAEQGGNPYAFQGDGNPVMRTLAPGVEVNIAVDATEAFGSGTDSIFHRFDELATAVRNNTGIHEATSKVKSQQDRFLKSLGVLGATQKRVEALKDRAINQLASLKVIKSDAESADLAEVSVEVMTQKVAYEAALSATAKVIQPSLMDFLR